MFNTLQSAGLTILSALLLICAYPQLSWWLLAWVGVIPLLILIDGKKNKSAFLWSLLAGFLFFFGTLGWLVYVTTIGAVLLVAYLALYVGFFALGYKHLATLSLMPRVLSRAALWTILEYIRSTAFTGFGWALLGHSQYQNTVLIQIANITGVYGISFLIILFNLMCAESIQFFRNKNDLSQRSMCLGWLLVISVIVGVYVYGMYQLNQTRIWPTMNIAVIQPNIPQEMKWQEPLKEIIVDKHIQLTALLQDASLDLIVWPETALPGITDESYPLMHSISLTAIKNKVPILFGAMTHKENRYYNSALLFNAQGKAEGQYDKIHLVPFGEYLPLRPLLGWINRFVPLEDFSSGEEYTIFNVGKYHKSVGVLICFEDTLSHIRRSLTKAGAKVWVNITNDAWFHDTKAPFMHLQAAVFGCVENRRALVRAANTGFSGFIDPLGRVTQAVQNKDGKKTFIAGVASYRVALVETMTFYTKYADVFTWCCFLGILSALIRVRILKTKRISHAKKNPCS